MLTETEILIQPYSSQKGKSLLEVLIEQFEHGNWSRFQMAVAFLRETGNFPRLIEAMQKFIENNGTIEMTVGADTFGRQARGSDYEAVEQLLSKLTSETNFKLFLYHERLRTFHPKLYLFSDEQTKRAFLIIGSSNWSYGGLVDNVEANVLIKFDLSNDEQLHCYEQITDYFASYWTDING